MGVVCIWNPRHSAQSRKEGTSQLLNVLGVPAQRQKVLFSNMRKFCGFFSLKTPLTTPEDSSSLHEQSPWEALNFFRGRG